MNAKLIIKAIHKNNIIGKSKINFRKKINEIKNKDIRNSLSQLLNTIKDDQI